MMKYTRLTCFLFAFIVSTQALSNPQNSLLKSPGVLTICSYSEFKPVSYSHGKGYEADLLRAIATLWGVKIRFYTENTYEGIWRLPSREYTACDISIGGMTPIESRHKQGAVFSIPTTRFKQSLLIRTNDYKNGSIRSYDDFKNNQRKIGVVPGTTGEAFAHLRAKEEGVNTSTFVQYASESELLPALKQGKIDAIARGEIGNEYQASLDPNLMVIAKKDYHESFAFAVNPNKPQLLHAINLAINQVTHHGEIGFSSWLKNHAVFSQQVISYKKL